MSKETVVKWKYDYENNQWLQQKADGSWYYPWNQPTDVPAPTAPSCQHEYVDVGFMHPKEVCRHCDKEKIDGQ